MAEHDDLRCRDHISNNQRYQRFLYLYLVATCMRILFQLVTSLERRRSRPSTFFDRVTFCRKALFRSKILFLVVIIRSSTRLSFGFNLPNRIPFYRTSLSRASFIHLTFHTTRKYVTTTMVDDVDFDSVDGNDDVKPKTRKRRSGVTAKPNVLNERPETDAGPKKKGRSSTGTSPSTSTSASLRSQDDAVDEGEKMSVSKQSKKVKPPAHQVITNIDEIPKLWNDEKAAANGSYSKL